MSEVIIDAINNYSDENDENEIQTLQIKCKGEDQVWYARELAMEIHALSGRLFRLLDGETLEMDGDEGFLEKVKDSIDDLWSANIQICYLEDDD